MPKESTAVKQSWLDRSALPNFKISWETLLLAILLVAAVVTRFYILGERTMSHDETTHVLYSWELQQGNGYAHDPLSHGPFQFHILALTYFLFGDNDFTARAPHALFSVMTVLFVWWAFRRYIGRVGALVAAFFFLISPYMLYYGRYARNESFVALFGLVVIWAVLRFLDRGDYKYLWVMTAATALHFASKETAFIYTAQMLLFLGLVFLVRIGSHKWRDANSRSIFFGVLILTAALLLLAIAGHTVLDTGPGSVSGTEVLEPVDAAAGTAAAAGAGTHPVVLILGGLGVLTLVGSLVVLARGYGWDRLKAERSFGVMLLMFALVLPHLAAFPLKLIRPDLTFSYFRSVFIGFNFGSFFSSPDLGNVLLLIVSVFVFFAISAVLGWLWNPRQWLINMAIFFAIFLPLFTTMFTNSLGLFTGLVGSLGYWMEQQAVQRGSQPQYYYVGVQIPIYEFLALAGTLLAAWIGARLWWKERDGATETRGENENLRPAASRRLALWMLAFWTVSSAAAYTIAGEKMPWLTVHIALPMLLLSGWAISWVLKRVDWPAMASARGLWITGATILAVLSALGLLGMLLGLDTPFRGLEQDSLQDTLRFVFTAILLAASIWVLLRYRGENWPRYQTRHAFILVIFAGLAFLTARAAFRGNYINYDLATEYLVYAHMARGPKEMMEQLEELSLRTTDGLGIRVAYDNETNYPLWWYLRNYPNKVYYDVNPSAGLRDMPVIIVGDANYGKIEPIVRDDYYVQEFVRIWWPNQDYFDFTPQSVGFAFTSETGLDASQMGAVDYWGRAIARILAYVDTPEERNATLDIWLNRDFTDYLSIKGQDTSLAKWNPSRTMRMYIRKDIAAQIWDYGVAPVAIEPDPYEGLGRQVAADLIVGFAGTNLGEFNAPRGLAAAPDGSVYVADSFNHRIQHLAADGSVINAWGTPSDPNAIEKAPASFNEPWGVAVSPDGRFVYVADTWNHRVQKFTAAGEFVTSWGIFGNVSDEVSLYGPRDVAVTEDDHVLVTDTGNKRIVVYDANGVFVSQVGGSGIDLGKFEEPVGLAYDLENSLLYVADTWNQRIQVLSYSDGMLTPQDAWEIEAWFGQSLNNKPYLTVGEDGKVYVSDPETARVLVFNSDGTLEYFFGGYDQTAVQIGLAQGISSDGNGGLWLSDSQNQYILHFTLP